MFGDDKNDSWKWMPHILIVGALVFLFFDPLGIEGTKVKYLVSLNNTMAVPQIPAVPGVPPVPPAGNPPAVMFAAGVSDYPDVINTGPQTPPTKLWPKSGNGTWINIGEDADGFIFNGCVRTTAAGIRITNSEIRGNCATSQLYDEAGSGTFEYNNIFDVGGAGTSTIGCGSNSRFFRNNAKGATDGVKEGQNCQIIENYIHDLDEYTLGTPNNGVRIENGNTRGMIIQKNTFENTCGKLGSPGQGCAGVVFIAGGASENMVDGNYVKRWDGPSAGFIFHLADAGVNEVKNNVVECANTTGFGVQNGGPSTYVNNTECL